MKQEKQLSRFRRGRVSAQRELRKQRRIRDNLERQLFTRLTSLFGKFINTRAFIYREFGQFDIGISARDLELELVPVIQRHYRRVFVTLYRENNRTNTLEAKDDVVIFGRNKDLEPFLEEYFRERQLILAGISANIAKRIDRVIRRGRRVGLTLPEIAANIEKVRALARPRAATIARTETHNAAGFAQHRYYKEVEKDYGSKLKKKWVATNDPRTRDAHSLMNLEEPINMDETFIVGGKRMQHTGDPKGGPENNVNCRCIILYVDEQDVVLD